MFALITQDGNCSFLEDFEEGLKEDLGEGLKEDLEEEIEGLEERFEKIFGKRVPVIKFVTNTTANSDKVTTTNTNGNFELSQNGSLLKTHDITICFRFMFQVPRETKIIKNDQFGLNLGYSEGWVSLRPRNETTRVEERPYQYRMIKFCKPFEPGQWMSMCVRIQLLKNIQKIKVYQNGKLCFQNVYEDGDFEWIYHRRHISIKNV